MRGYDGVEYGPADEATLRRWCAERRVISSTPVREESGEWVKAANLPVLREFFASGDSHHTLWPTSVIPSSFSSVLWALGLGWSLLWKNWTVVIPVWAFVLLLNVGSGLFGAAGSILSLLASGPLFTGFARVLISSAQGQGSFNEIGYGFRRFMVSSPVHWLRQLVFFLGMLAVVFLIFPDKGQDLMILAREQTLPNDEMVTTLGPMVLSILAYYLLVYAFFWWADLSLAWSQTECMLGALRECVITWLKNPVPCLMFLTSMFLSILISALLLLLPMLVLGPWICFSVAIWFMNWKKSQTLTSSSVS